MPVSLVVLAAGAAAYAYAVDRGTISDADRAARRGEAFPSFRVDRVSRIELDQAGQSLVLEREADGGPVGTSGWVITAPRRERADPAEVDTLLRELELARRLRDVAEEDAAGLSQPRIVGRVNVGSIEYRFVLGGDAPRPAGAAYMQLDGGRPFVVGRSLTVQLLRGFDAYRDRVLFPYGASDTARVDVTATGGSGSSFAIERRGATFRVVGSGVRASRAAVDQLFAAMGDTRAEAFLDDAQADAALKSAAWTVALTPRSGERAPVALRIGGKCPTQSEGVVVVKDGPPRIAVCAPATLALALQSVPGDLADTSPLFARADEIEELRLEAPPGTAHRIGRRADSTPALSPYESIDLARKDRGWRERSPEERDLEAGESESVNALADALAGARATQARPATGDDAFAVSARATIVRAGGGVSEVVEVGPPGPDGSSPMRRRDDGAILRVPAAVARRFRPQSAALRARAIWSSPVRPRSSARLDAGSVAGVDDTCGEPQRLELRHGVWTLRKPAGFVADALSVADLVDAFAHANAEAWIADADDGTFGFGGPGSCQVAFTMDGGPGGEQRASVEFGGAGDGGVYARLSGDGAVFVAAADLRETASHPAVDRRPFHLDTAALQEVALAREGRRAVFVRSGSGRLLANGESEPPALALRTDTSPDAAASGEAIEAALRGLSASAALHTGPPAQGEGFATPTLEIRATARSDAGATNETRIAIGAPTRVGSVDAYFARIAGVDATYAVPRAAVKGLLDRW
jgi:hypothetical protein